MSESNCDLHGPYDAALGSCPFCRGSKTLSEDASGLNEFDNIPTILDFGGDSPGGDRVLLDELPTRLSEWGTTQPDGDPKNDIPLNLAPVETAPVVKEPGLLAIFWVKDGPRRGSIINIRHGDVIGRENCELTLDDQKVSTIHAKITFEDSQFFLWDFASMNGTFVNGVRIRGATALKENDLIKIGDTTFVLKVLD
jgi:hypothetical protein